MLQWLGIAHISVFNAFWPNILTFSVISLHVHTSPKAHKVPAKQAGRCAIRQPLGGNQTFLQIPLRAQHFPDSSHGINTAPMEAQGKKEESCFRLAWCAMYTLSQQGHLVIDLPSPAQKNKGFRLMFRKMWDTFPHIFFFMMVLSFLYGFIIFPRDQKWLKVILSKWQKSDRQDHGVPDNVSLVEVITASDFLLVSIYFSVPEEQFRDMLRVLEMLGVPILTLIFQSPQATCFHKDEGNVRVVLFSRQPLPHTCI